MPPGSTHQQRRARPGLLGRIGIIQPTPGIMLEYEWPRWLPEEVLFPVMRVAMKSATTEGYRDVVAQAPEAARQLAIAGANVAAFACTIGSLIEGPPAEEAMLAAMAEAAGIPALSLGTSSVAALRQIRAKRVAIMTPYPDDTDALVERYLRASGFDVAGFIKTPVDIATVGDLADEEIVALASDALTVIDADALWIPCTAIRTLGAIEAIERVSGVAAISASQALLWRGLEMLEVAAPKARGRLFGQAQVQG
jgi:maleate isomerase